jgi:hypothetical protein
MEHDALAGAGTVVPATWRGTAALERAWTGRCGRSRRCRKRSRVGTAFTAGVVALVGSRARSAWSSAGGSFRPRPAFSQAARAVLATRSGEANLRDSVLHIKYMRFSSLCDMCPARILKHILYNYCVLKFV